MFLLLLALMQTPADCTFKDVHGFTQQCSIKQQCGHAQHLHNKANTYTVYPPRTADGKTAPPTKQPGDGLCHYDSSDSVGGPPRGSGIAK